MDNHNEIEKSWDAMTYDFLVSTLLKLHVLDLVLRVSRVSRYWESICSNPCLWNTLDLTVLGKYFFIPKVPHAWSGENSANLLRSILRHAFHLSRGNITKLIFNFYVSLNDEHLYLAVESCPRLKHLVLPPCGQITQSGLYRALAVRGSGLESLIVPYVISFHRIILKIIGLHCPALKELKFARRLTKRMATTLTNSLQSLKVLSLRGSVIDKDALEFILENMVNLEVLNITHSLVVDTQVFVGIIASYPNLTDKILEMASRLSEFHSCKKLACSTCAVKFPIFATAMGKIETWYFQVGEDFWRDDEVRSLAY